MNFGCHDTTARAKQSQQAVSDPGSSYEMAGRSEAFRTLCSFVSRLAPTKATVLITGETGTGKELIAAMVHRKSKRAKGPLVAINCAAIPDALLEGELFGYERGAFSGALSAYPGKLKLADGGTLLLDEVGELSVVAQAKLLRAIDTGEAYRLGARIPSRFDIRIIASTNRNLAHDVADGKFRSDLYYRLAVARLEMPPLRMRIEDILPIARQLLARIAEEFGQPELRLDQSAIRRLEQHDWPGNARELRNVLEVAAINSDSGCISDTHLPLVALDRLRHGCSSIDEKTIVIAALEHARGNKSLAALSLNCSRMTLYRRMSRLGIA
jgi:DNA-binding NtrC family response regulator